MDTESGGKASKRERYQELIGSEQMEVGDESLGYEPLPTITLWADKDALLQKKQIKNQDLAQDTILKRKWSNTLGKWAAALIVYQMALVTAVCVLSFFIPIERLEIFKWVIGVALGGSFAQVVSLIGIVLKYLFPSRK